MYIVCLQHFPLYSLPTAICLKCPLKSVASTKQKQKPLPFCKVELPVIIIYVLLEDELQDPMADGSVDLLLSQASLSAALHRHPFLSFIPPFICPSFPSPLNHSQLPFLTFFFFLSFLPLSSFSSPSLSSFSPSFLPSFLSSLHTCFLPSFPPRFFSLGRSIHVVLKNAEMGFHLYHHCKGPMPLFCFCFCL